MNAYIRVILFTLATTLFLYLCSELMNTQWALAIGLACNIFAAPYSQIITNWVQGKNNSTVNITSAMTIPPNNKGGINAVTSLWIFYVNVYSFLLANVAALASVYQIDVMEHAGLIRLSDLGYTEIQKYMNGAFLLIIWLPASTTLSFALGGGSRPLPFTSFLLGAALAIPVYFVAAHALHLPTGFGDATVPSRALGATLPAIPGYHGFEITALLMQVSAIALIITVAALYSWLAALLARLVKRITVAGYNYVATNLGRRRKP